MAKRFIAALGLAASLSLGSWSMAQETEIGPVNPGAEELNGSLPLGWYYGLSGTGIVNATAGSGFNGTNGFGVGVQSNSGMADLRSEVVDVRGVLDGKVDFSFRYRLLADFPSAGFPSGNMRVQLRFFGGATAPNFGDYRGGTEVFVGAATGDVGSAAGTWKLANIDDFAIPAGGTFIDIRVPVGIFDTNFVGAANFDDFSVRAVVPEPAGLALLALGSLGLLRRRRD